MNLQKFIKICVPLGSTLPKFICNINCSPKTTKTHWSIKFIFSCLEIFLEDWINLMVQQIKTKHIFNDSWNTNPQEEVNNNLSKIIIGLVVIKFTCEALILSTGSQYLCRSAFLHQIFNLISKCSQPVYLSAYENKKLNKHAQSNRRRSKSDEFSISRSF